jgi:hypothetical protein
MPRSKERIQKKSNFQKKKAKKSKMVSVLSEAILYFLLLCISSLDLGSSVLGSSSRTLVLFNDLSYLTK